jgi:hypothetical protein
VGSRENGNPKKDLRPPFFGSFFGRAKNEQINNCDEQKKGTINDNIIKNAVLFYYLILISEYLYLKLILYDTITKIKHVHHTAAIGVDISRNSIKIAVMKIHGEVLLQNRILLNLIRQWII